jgi:hypothetical protein
MRFIVPVCLLVILSFTEITFAQDKNLLRVNESITKLSFKDKSTTLSLPIENLSNSSLSVLINIEFLDPKNSIHADIKINRTIKPGMQTIIVPISLQSSNFEIPDTKEFLWYRMRYRISTDNQLTLPAEGIVSISEITPDLFILEGYGDRFINTDMRYHARIRAVHPITRRPVKDVKVEALLRFGLEEDKQATNASGTTDSNGYITFSMEVPQNINTNTGTLTLKANRGELYVEKEERVEFQGAGEILISTDKPIYQPGQMLHLRLYATEYLTRRAIADTDIELKIQDPEYKTIFSSTVKTSKFGVASLDWSIPDNLRLGNYFVEANIETGIHEDSRGFRSITISRYDLPNFTVSVKPDRTYYLSDQNAEVEVKADYLFGKPVKQGKVRVVKEGNRKWNYPEQRWEIDEEKAYEGELNSGGRFITNIDLKEEYKELKESKYQQFTDISYTAYVTDTTTGKTEQRQFDLRITKEAIHIYIIKDLNSYSLPYHLPTKFYISTYYADGTPAQCEVSLKVKYINEENNEKETVLYQPLLRVKTNRYGLAKVSELRLVDYTNGKEKPLLNLRTSNKRSILSLNAVDKQKRSGSMEEALGFNDEPVVQVETDKTIYRPDEPILVKLRSNKPDLITVVDVINNGKVLHTESIKLQRGKASILIPYEKEFKNIVSIRAIGDQGINDLCNIIYPKEDMLNINLSIGKSLYKPGEEVEANVKVSKEDLSGSDSVLGVVVIDKAIEDRARVAQEFGGGESFYNAYMRHIKENSVAGISLIDLKKLNISRPLPVGMELVAEVLLNSYRWINQLNTFSSERYELNSLSRFTQVFESQLKPLEESLNSYYRDKKLHPKDRESLKQILSEFKLDIDQIRDPWGTSFIMKFTVEGSNQVLSIWSAGPDKRIDTRDDLFITKLIWPYFSFYGERLNQVIRKITNLTGNFTNDVLTIKDRIKEDGLDFDRIKDPWGHSHKMEIDFHGSSYLIKISSAGPDGIFNKNVNYAADDLIVWVNWVYYFEEERLSIGKALAEYIKESKRFPRDESEFVIAMKGSDLDFNNYKDVWGGRLYVKFGMEELNPDGTVIQPYSFSHNQPKQSTNNLIKRKGLVVQVFSKGKDQTKGTEDDFSLAAFSQTFTEYIAGSSNPELAIKDMLLGKGSSIAGTITDPVGAVIPDVQVTITNTLTNHSLTTTTNEEGFYTVGNLPLGIYQIVLTANGFKKLIMENITVSQQDQLTLNLSLEIGAVTEMVDVMVIDNLPMKTSSALVGEVKKVSTGTRASKQEIATPRLREYFPETLLWQPSIETDKKGRAKLRFKLADTITTWKISIVGSTIDGELGVIEKEIQAFQPFFVEHDPPKVLTEGDKISLPTILRNYLDRSQSVEVSIKPDAWFSIIGTNKKALSIPAGESIPQVFDLKAITSIKEGRQEITALGREASDSIVKTITVRPDGEEIASSKSTIFKDTGLIDLDLPAQVIKGSLNAELKIYPNLMAHVFEGIEGILQRPYGCGEQTISSTYPNLMVLRYLKHNNISSPAIETKARENLKAGYQRLLNYKAKDGGFSYWGYGEANLSLTTYALRFLYDAKEFLDIDQDIIEETKEWIIKKQQEDGSWNPNSYWAKDNILQTLYTTRILSSLGKVQSDSSKESSNQSELSTTKARTSALKYLSTHISNNDDPYQLSLYALALMEAGDMERTKEVVDKLCSLAKEDSDGYVWLLNSYTPFHGWGRAGHIETTALVIQALEKYRQLTQSTDDPGSLDNRLINGGLHFLIRNKDRYGVWLSTQATINVLDTLISLTEHRDAKDDTSRPVDIFVNGKQISSVSTPILSKSTQPIVIDLTQSISNGSNQVEIKRQGVPIQSAANIVATYYIPWSYSSSLKRDRTSSDAEALRFKVDYDRTNLKIGEKVVCRVEAERVGDKGYGMLLAEIGLPPGAAVDQASLKRAIEASDWTINRYDVLPDRVVVYLWPRKEPIRFNFKFKLRYGIEAQTSASQLYDYYNPEAKTVIAPKLFIVR